MKDLISEVCKINNRDSKESRKKIFTRLAIAGIILVSLCFISGFIGAWIIKSTPVLAIFLIAFTLYNVHSIITDIITIYRRAHEE